MTMNETLVQFFQVKPVGEQWEGRQCVFMNEGLDLDYVRYISPVQAYSGIAHYYFTISLSVGRDIRELRYDFANRATAIKAHREFYAAYTKTGEYKIVEQEQTDNTIEGQASTS